MSFGEDDLDGMFNEFVEDATLESGGKTIPARVILSRTYAENESGYLTENCEVTADIKSSSAPSVKRNDTLTVTADGSVWYISKVRKDGTGITQLTLSEDPV